MTARPAPTTPGRPSILLVDDHRIVREGLRRILAEAFPDAIFGEAATATEALLAASRGWDLVVLDVSLPSRSGLDVLKELRATQPEARVLMTTMYAEEQYALRSLRAGAAGYITKGSGPDEFVAAARKVLEGGKYVSATLAEHLAGTLQTDASGRPAHERLSDRELQVLRLLATGLSVKEIGHQLHLSDKTISTYRARVLDKLQLRTAAQLMRYAIGANLVD